MHTGWLSWIARNTYTNVFGYAEVLLLPSSNAHNRYFSLRADGTRQCANSYPDWDYDLTTWQPRIIHLIIILASG